MSDEMISDFQIEATELFLEAEDSLLAIDKGADFKQNFNQLFRAFHSIKGAAGMFGFDELQKHMHFLENLLSEKKSLLNLSAAAVDYFLEGVDAAREILNNQKVEFKQFDPDNPETAEKIKLKQEIIEKKQKNITKKNGVVWVVDDEEDILEVLSDLLEDANYEVSIFDRAPKLLDNLNITQPDLILSDINMPEMDGVELVKKVNQIKPHLPVVVVSGFVTKQICLDALSHGVAGIIEKPFESENILRVTDLNVNRYQNLKLMNRSIDLLIYQFENFPAEKRKEAGFYKNFKNELTYILKQKKILFSNLK